LKRFVFFLCVYRVTQPTPKKKEQDFTHEAI
jgi:hypothetical protein